MQKLIVPIGSLVAFFVLLYLFSFALGPVPLNLNSVVTNNLDSFTSTGEGEAVGAPDIAKVTIGVTAQGNNVEQAQEQVNSSVKKITDALKKNGVKESDIKTLNYSINPDYDFNTPNNKITGYTVTQNLEVTADPIDKINSIVDTATAQGANQVGSVTFDFSDKLKEELTKKARKMAIDDAKASGQELAGLAGIKLGRVINATESSFDQVPVAYSPELRTADALEKTPTNITAGEGSVKLSVTLTYQTN